MKSAPSRTFVLATLLAAQFVTPLAIAGVAVGFPAISLELGTDPAPLQWVVNSFNVAFAIFTLVWGFGGDKLGHVRTFTLGIVICFAASIWSACASSLLVLDAARALGGIGAAAIITSASALISQRFQGVNRARAFALFGTINGLGLALGPTISGALVMLGGWRFIFVAHSVLLVFSLVGSWFLNQDQRKVTLITPAKRADNTRARIGSLTHAGYLAMLVVPVAGAAGFVTLLTYLPAALQSVQNMAPGSAGLMMLAMTVPVLIAPTLVHAISQRAEARRSGRADAVSIGVCVIALLFLVAAPLGLLGFSADTPPVYLILVMVIAGLGFGLPLGIVDGRALSFIPEQAQGLAAGILNFFRIGSEALFVTVYAVILTATIRSQPAGESHVDAIAAGQPGHSDVYAAAMVPVLWSIAGCCAVLLIVFLVLVRLERREKVMH